MVSEWHKKQRIYSVEIMSIKNAAKALIVNDGKILLNKCLNTFGDFAWGSPNGTIYYNLPGGGQNKFEFLEDTIKRECLEETGYSVSIERLKAIYEEVFIMDTSEMDDFQLSVYEQNNHKIYFVFLCHLDDQTQKVATEIDVDVVGFEWVAIEEVKNLLLFPEPFHDNFDLILNTITPVFLGSTQIDMRK